MITIEQCRGARGVLGWTQQDLADACGLSKTAINNFEKGHSDIKAESLRSIRVAFESADIEFIGHEGITKKVETVRILRGPNALNDLLDDIEKHVTNKKTEILISNIDQSFVNRVSSQKLFRHIDLLKTQNIKERIICTHGTNSVFSPEDDCRWIPEKNASESVTTFIYANKIAIELWDQSMIIIISSAEASEAERNRFESRWVGCKTPSQDTKKIPDTKTA